MFAPLGIAEVGVKGRMKSEISTLVVSGQKHIVQSKTNLQSTGPVVMWAAEVHWLFSLTVDNQDSVTLHGCNVDTCNGAEIGGGIALFLRQLLQVVCQSTCTWGKLVEF